MNSQPRFVSTLIIYSFCQLPFKKIEPRSAPIKPAAPADNVPIEPRSAPVKPAPTPEVKPRSGGSYDGVTVISTVVVMFWAVRGWWN